MIVTDINAFRQSYLNMLTVDYIQQNHDYICSPSSNNNVNDHKLSCIKSPQLDGARCDAVSAGV